MAAEVKSDLDRLTDIWREVRYLVKTQMRYPNEIYPRGGFVIGTKRVGLAFDFYGYPIGATREQKSGPIPGNMEKGIAGISWIESFRKLRTVEEVRQDFEYERRHDLVIKKPDLHSFQSGFFTTEMPVTLPSGQIRITPYPNLVEETKYYENLLNGTEHYHTVKRAEINPEVLLQVESYVTAIRGYLDNRELMGR